jgi:hypothetical protein
MKDVTESSKTDFFLKMPNFLASMSDSCKDYFPSWSTSRRVKLNAGVVHHNVIQVHVPLPRYATTHY